MSRAAPLNKNSVGTSSALSAATASKRVRHCRATRTSWRAVPTAVPARLLTRRASPCAMSACGLKAALALASFPRVRRRPVVLADNQVRQDKLARAAPAARPVALAALAAPPAARVASAAPPVARVASAARPVARVASAAPPVARVDLAARPVARVALAARPEARAATAARPEAQVALAARVVRLEPPGQAARCAPWWLPIRRATPA